MKQETLHLGYGLIAFDGRHSRYPSAFACAYDPNPVRKRGACEHAA